MSEPGAAPDAADLRTRLRRLKRRVARRHEQVERLRAQVQVLSDEVRSPLDRTVGGSADPERELGVPSYSLAARLHKRANTSGVNRSEGMAEPILQLSPKLPAKRFATLHGVPVPRILGRWSDPDAIDWDSLPDRFVLKSNVGGGAVNVFPLARDPQAGTYTDLLVDEPTTPAGVVEKLWARHNERSLYFAEELLVGRTGDDDAVPSDVKVFCFYGEPVYLEVRRGDQSRADQVTSRARSYTADGAELANARALIDPGKGELEALDDLDGVLAAAARLSAAIRRPLERLDFFETDHGLVFGEVTQNPGHLPALASDWDRRLGEAYEAAYARLLSDLAAEGALHVELGSAGRREPVR